MTFRLLLRNRIGAVMVSVLSQTKDYEISILCFSAKHAPLWSDGKDRLARNQSNVTE